MISIDNLVKSYNGRVVLSIDSLCFEEDKKYALIGPNGSGKSTLLKILAGAIKQDSGSIKNSVAAGLVGYMPQKPYAFSLTLQKNVELAIKEKEGRAAKALAAIERVGLSALANKAGDMLSGGEAQRMAFARLMVQSNDLLLLDEPTSQCDIASVDRIEELIVEYAKENKCTIIFSTHSPAEALRVADMAIFLEGGRICEAGSTEALLHSPNSKQLQEFLRHWRI